MIRRSLLGLAAIAAAGLFLAAGSAAMAETPPLVKSAQSAVLVAVAAEPAVPHIQYAVAVVEVDQVAPAALVEAAYDPRAAGTGHSSIASQVAGNTIKGSPEVLSVARVTARRTWIV